MKSWQQFHTSGDWSGGFMDWVVGDTAYLSVVFSWQLADAYQRAIWHQQMGRKVRAGGPAVAVQPDYLLDVAEIGGEIDALPHHNPNATFTSRGCIRHCPFCAVPKIEGDLVELDDWPIRPIVCDNNLLACSTAHFDDVIDKLKPLSGVDFNQGLDARLLTAYHAMRLAELDLYAVRLAWDDIRSEAQFLSAFQKLVTASIPAALIRVYILIGFRDTPEDALYRLETVKQLGALTAPMRYQPLMARRRNEYVGDNWTEAELQRFMVYWYNLRRVGAIPFENFRYPDRKRPQPSGQQLELIS